MDLETSRLQNVNMPAYYHSSAFHEVRATTDPLYKWLFIICLLHASVRLTRLHLRMQLLSKLHSSGYLTYWILPSWMAQDKRGRASWLLPGNILGNMTRSLFLTPLERFPRSQHHQLQGTGKRELQ
ncbi:hypothetical protein VPH35_021623 [Triticum aestivum]